MYKRIFLAASIMASVYASPLLADAPKSGPCKNAVSAQSQAVCVQQQLDKLTAKLNDTYTKSLAATTQLDKSPNGAIKKTLESSQQNWDNYLKASCDNAAAVYQGKDDASTQIVDCKKQIIKARTKQLTQLYLSQQ